MPSAKPSQERVQIALDKLTKAEIEKIQKTNPFRNERNSMIRKLHVRGMTLGIIAAISGYSNDTIVELSSENIKLCFDILKPILMSS